MPGQLGKRRLHLAPAPARRRVLFMVVSECSARAAFLASAFAAGQVACARDIQNLRGRYRFVAANGRINERTNERNILRGKGLANRYSFRRTYENAVAKA